MSGFVVFNSHEGIEMDDLQQCAAMVDMLEDGEWAEHVGRAPVAARLEVQITRLHNDLSESLEARRWIPVAEAMPEVGQLVLVAFDTGSGKNYTTAKLSQDGRAHFECLVWYVHVSGGHQLKTVTHWRAFEPVEKLADIPQVGQARRKVPYGNEIYEGTRMRHPDGSEFTVAYDAARLEKGLQWRAIYDNGDNLWLDNQVGPRGLAEVVKP